MSPRLSATFLVDVVLDLADEVRASVDDVGLLHEVGDSVAQGDALDLNLRPPDLDRGAVEGEVDPLPAVLLDVAGVGLHSDVDLVGAEEAVVLP